jgi:HSP20 family molecular chaperone IbpA
MSEMSQTTCESRNGAATDREAFRPQVDVYETDDQYVLVADVPGAGEGDIDLAIEKDVLSLQARVDEPNFDGYATQRRGFRFGDWKRSFRLSDAVERDGIDAVIKDGVLRITLPKAKESLRKSIPVKRID